MEVILFTSGREGQVRGALWPGMGGTGGCSNVRGDKPRVGKPGPTV